MAGMKHFILSWCLASFVIAASQSGNGSFFHKNQNPKRLKLVVFRRRTALLSSGANRKWSHRLGRKISRSKICLLSRISFGGPSRCGMSLWQLVFGCIPHHLPHLQANRVQLPQNTEWPAGYRRQCQVQNWPAGLCGMR